MRRQSYSNDNNVNGNNQQVKLEDYLEDDEAESSDSEDAPIIASKRRNRMENNHNHDNSLHGAKSHGSQFRARDGSVSMTATDLASSTRSANCGETRSKLLLESPPH